MPFCRNLMEYPKGPWDGTWGIPGNNSMPRSNTLLPRTNDRSSSRFIGILAIGGWPGDKNSGILDAIRWLDNAERLFSPPANRSPPDRDKYGKK